MTRDYWLDRLSEPCPETKGQRVELVSMDNDPNPVPAGTRGTVTGGNGGQVWVTWDNGRRLALVVGEDQWRRISEEEKS